MSDLWNGDSKNIHSVAANVKLVQNNRDLDRNIDGFWYFVNRRL